MKIKRMPERIFRFFSALAVAATAYGFWCVVLVAAGHLPQDGRLWMLTGFGCAVSISGWAVGVLVPGNRVWVWDVCRWVWCVGAAVAGFFMASAVPELNLVMKLLNIPLSFGMAYIGTEISQRQPGLGCLLITGCTLLGMGVITRLTDGGWDLSLTPFVWILFFQTAAISLGANYSNIDRLMDQRGHSKRNLPPKIRRNNVILVSVFLAVVGAALLGRNLFGDFAQKLFGYVLLAILYVIRGVAWLLGHLAPGGGASGGGVIAPPAMSGVAEAQEENGIDWLFWVAFALLMAAIIFYCAPRLWKNFVEKLRVLREKLRRWRGRVAERAARLEEGEEYTDLEESISTNEERLDGDGTINRRGWKKQHREWKSMAPGREKYARGYALALRGAGLRGGSVSAADTPQEAEAHSREYLGESFREVTEKGELMAFSPAHPVPEGDALEKTLEELKKQI